MERAVGEGAAYTGFMAVHAEKEIQAIDAIYCGISP